MQSSETMYERVKNMRKPVLLRCWDGSNLWLLPGEVVGVQSTNKPEQNARIFLYSGTSFLLKDTVESVLERLNWDCCEDQE